MNQEEVFQKYNFRGDPNNKQDVYQFLLTESSNGFMKKEYTFKICFPLLYQELKSRHWEQNWPFSRILLHYFNPTVVCTCRTCGSPSPFKNFKQGYQEYCCSKCANANKDKKEKTINTVLKKYGVDNVFKSDKIKTDIEHANQKKYGKKHASQNKLVKEKTKNTCRERYGVDCPFEMIDFKEKTRQTSQKKYGTDYPIQSEIIKSQLFQNYNNKTGYYNPSYNPEVIEDCNICNQKSFNINKKLFSQRSSQGIILCPIKLPDNGTSSIIERSFLSFIRQIYNGEILTNDRTLISPYELDIYLPEKKIAFEFNGIFWHSDFNPRIDKYYHQKKSLLCQEKEVQLLHIWEDDWKLKADIIKDYIKAKLGQCEKRIYARKCSIREIDGHTAKEFTNSNHIQGYVNSTYKIGLFHEEDLISVMLIGKLRNTMGSKPKKDCYEIYRVVSDKGIEVVGGFSKMLAYFERIYKPKEIITYGDLCYTNGNVYRKCGFEMNGLSRPCYYWQINGIRYHRSNFMKGKLIECQHDASLTENEVMRARHAYKIWDAGKIKFTKKEV